MQVFQHAVLGGKRLHMSGEATSSSNHHFSRTSDVFWEQAGPIRDNSPTSAAFGVIFSAALSQCRAINLGGPKHPEHVIWQSNWPNLQSSVCTTVCTCARIKASPIENETSVDRFLSASCVFLPYLEN